MGDRGHKRHGPKRGGCCAPFAEGELSPRQIQRCQGRGLGLPPYQVASWSIQPFGGLATIDMGQKLGGAVPFLRGTGSLSNIKSLGPRPTKWHLSPSSHLATTDIGRKMGVLCRFREGGAGSPSNTMWPRPRSTCLLSYILIHSTVWPQYTNVTDRTDRQTTVW